MTNVVQKVSARVLTSAGFLLPVLAFAQNTTIENKAIGFTNTIGTIVGLLIPIAFGLAVVAFFWGLALFIFSPDDNKDKGKTIMLWGTIALFIMASIWGIAQLLRSTLGIGNSTDTSVPGIKSDKSIYE